MSYVVIAPQGTATISVPASSKIAVQTQGVADVFQEVGYPNYPAQQSLLQSVVNTTYTSSAFAAAATVTISAGAAPVYYEVGTDPVINFGNGNWQPQGAPANIADGGSMVMTAADCLTGIVTATPTTGRNVQLPTAAAIAASTNLPVGESFDWSLITLAAFALTITVNTNHTIVGAAATAGTSGAAARFRTRRDTATTAITYRLA